MTAIAWFLSEAAFPVSLGVAFALAIDVARRPRVRHYRWRNRRFVRRVRELELRSRAGVGSALPPDRWPVPPGTLSGAAGVERGGHPHSAAAPPATQHLAGAACSPAAAPARPHLVRLGGVL